MVQLEVGARKPLIANEVQSVFPVVPGTPGLEVMQRMFAAGLVCSGLCRVRLQFT